MMQHHCLIAVRSSGDLIKWILFGSIFLVGRFTLTNLYRTQQIFFNKNAIEDNYLTLFNVAWNTSNNNNNNNSNDIITKNIQTLGLQTTTATTTTKTTKCIVHEPISINASSNRVSNPNVTILQQQTTLCAQLHRDWSYNPPISNIAKEIAHHQANCSLDVGSNMMDNLYGLGAHLVLWSQAVCNAMEEGIRVRTFQPEWLWLDQQHCNVDEAQTKSPLLCYFPKSEEQCNDKLNDNSIEPITSVLQRNITDPRDKKRRCKLLQDGHHVKQFRAASTEYIFQHVSPIVIAEAQRQLGILFGGPAPKDLITVHIRWGDKFWEMDLVPIDEYIDAIIKLLPQNNTTTANIYLATEDPKALNEFMSKVPQGWNVYVDVTINELNAFRPKKGNRASWTTRNTKGRAGLVALGSLLVALEANNFVLTTSSNWSSIMNHLRENVINPRCDNCTKMIDLRPGVW